jgi:DeoR/GlpR family transcriptional regulator of sugar metabolism
MLADLRRAEILERLARDYGVSPITVHRNLERLAREGLIERIYGGARLSGTSPTHSQVPTDWTKRLRQAQAQKKAIAATAADFVETVGRSSSTPRRPAWRSHAT